MSRTIRTLLCALCLLAFGLAAAPASAQPGPGPGPGPGSGPISMDSLIAPLPMIRMVKVTGAGETEAEALENALNMLEDDYSVLRYTVISSGCPEVWLYTYDDGDGLPEEHEIEVICWAEVRALVLVKAALTSS